MAGFSVGGLPSFIGDSRQSLQGQFAMSCQVAEKTQVFLSKLILFRQRHDCVDLLILIIIIQIDQLNGDHYVHHNLKQVMAIFKTGSLDR
ncbi:hypothetical protein WN51_09255 [Melipona quadrifasciata]|uniref:Uncharacterized protein n=1 Tax=Melipona quadrifasciata TaxID=166423 RepID=A0A0N0BIK7_9HYME|nr:hypothetical protein WN51_09255 [Melipona quadrifasciata]